MDGRALEWLLEQDNPGVRVRTLTGLCGRPADDPQVAEARALACDTLEAARDLAWMEDKGIKLIHNLTALAESGLTRRDVAVTPVVDRLLETPFDANCGDYLLLRALVMLGYGDDPRVADRLRETASTQLPDGGWLCLHRLRKMKRTPKSCMKAAMHALLLAGEMKQRGLPLSGSDALVRYFLKRRIFYRTGDPTQYVLHSAPGKRMTDAFFPMEFMRVGLPNLLEALAVLGAGGAPELQEAWELLRAKQDALGRVTLEGTLSRPHLPRERVGRPGKWVTLYAWLAYQAREGTSPMPPA